MEVVKRLNRELKYRGALIDIYSDTVELPNGHVAHWDYIHHDGAAAVVPVRDDGKILMVRQFRNALDRETLEIPAGKVDSPDEPKIQCAYRELEEETGYRSDNLEFLISVNTTVAFLDELIEIYVARDLVPTKQALDEDEFLDVYTVPLQELVRDVMDGRISDAKTQVAVLKAARMLGL